MEDYRTLVSWVSSTVPLDEAGSAACNLPPSWKGLEPARYRSHVHLCFLKDQQSARALREDLRAKIPQLLKVPTLR